MFYECAATPLGSNSSIRPPSDHIMLHIFDECIRWSTAVEIPVKTTEDIIDALQIHRLKLYGAIVRMIWDGERVMVSIEALQWS